MEKTTKYKDREIFYTDSGSGDIIVLVHGYLESSEVWGEFAEQLAKRYRVLSVDLPGNGRSDLYDEEHTMCFMAGAVKSVLDNEKTDRVVIAGHSLGGYVTLAFVENYPDMLRGYILFHSHPLEDTEEIKINRNREIDVVRSGKKDVIYPVNIPKMFADVNLEKFSSHVERSKSIASRQTPEGIISVSLGMMDRKNRENIVTSGNIPMLYILGKMDNYIPWDFAVKHLKTGLSGKIITLYHSGHMGFIEEMDLSVKIFNEFIEKLKTS
ncbi:MAG: alpha/beta hydrolase [Bacteroidales bacterium]|nr:alpha/beta hydrolase [Bacteroidales bacterium]